MDMNTLTQKQKVALAITPKITALISILALVYAVQLIIRTPHRMRILCNRILLGMYMTDILRCLTYLVGTWMIPVGTDSVFMATGTISTCRAQAFVSQFGLAVPLYALLFNFYFFIAIKNDFNHNRVRWAEKWCHIFPLSISLLLAILLLALQKDGLDVNRCWIPPTNIKCMNESFFYQEYEECSNGKEDMSFSGLVVTSWIFENGLVYLSILLSICLSIISLVTEMRKRKNGQSLQGKRLFFEAARKKKSRYFLTQMFAHVAAIIVFFGIFHALRYKCTNGGFPAMLVGSVLHTLFGAAAVAIFLSVKLPRNDNNIGSKFSLRRSVRSQDNFNLVTGGYVPKRTVIPKDDGGIYMGSDDEGDESMNEFEDEEYDISDYNMTFVTTRSVDLYGKKDDTTTW